MCEPTWTTQYIYQQPGWVAHNRNSQLQFAYEPWSGKKKEVNNINTFNMLVVNSIQPLSWWTRTTTHTTRVIW